MADKKPGTTIEYENRGRTRWIIELQPAKEGDPPEEIVFGDSADRIVQGTRHPIYQRDPVVRLTPEQEARLMPHSKRLLEKLTSGDQPEIERRERAA